MNLIPRTHSSHGQAKFRFHQMTAIASIVFLGACSTPNRACRCPAGALRCAAELNPEVKAPKAGKRLVMDLEDVQDHLRSTTPTTLLRDLASDVVRERLLYIQALSKIYSYRDLSKSDAKELEKFFEEMKDVEGLAGEFSRRLALTTLARKGGAGEKQIEVMEAERRDADRKDLKKLSDLGWSPDPIGRMNKLIRKIAEIDFGRRKEEPAASHDGIRELAKTERARLQTLGPFIEPNAYSERDLEKGLHTLRRSVRWVIQSMSASEGLYRLSDTITPQDRELNDAYSTSKYVKFSTVPGVEPLTVNRRAVLQLTKFVVELGLVKDFKEFELDYAIFLEKHGFEPNEKLALEAAHAVTVKAFGKEVDAETIGHFLYKYYLDQDPLKVIAHDLKD